jgi:hypothetical protein
MIMVEVVSVDNWKGRGKEWERENKSECNGEEKRV